MAKSPVIMKKLRQKMKVIMWIVAVAFIGLMVFTWGAGITGKHSNKGSTEAGMVNKERISHKELNDAYRNGLSQYQRSGQPITDETEESIRQSTWNNLVQSKLLMKRAEALSVDKVGADELYANIRRNPPDFIKNAQALQTDGKFDYSKFEAALRDPNQPWDQIENMVRSNLPFQKLQQIVQLMTFLPPTELRNVYESIAESVKVQYVRLGPWGLANFTPDTSGKTLATYYEQNKDKYKYTKAKAIMDYILIPLVSTSRDSSIAKKTIYDIYKELKGGEDFGYLARAYSEDYRTASHDGDMGFFAANQLEGKLDTIFSNLKPEEFSEPFMLGQGWHIVKLIEKQGQGDSLLYHGANIFIQIMPRETTRDSVRALAEKIWAVADSTGLKTAISKLGLTNLKVKTTSPFGERDVIDGIGGHSELASFAFSAPDTGKAIFRIIPTADGSYIYELKKRLPAGYPPLKTIRENVLSDMVQEQKREFIREKIENIYKDWQEKKISLKALAQKYNMQIDTTIYFTRNTHLNEPTPDVIFKAYAFRLKKTGEVSSPFVDDIGDGYILKLIKRIPPDWKAFPDFEKQVLGQIYQSKKGEIYNKWFEALMDKAIIKDYRNE